MRKMIDVASWQGDMTYTNSQCYKEADIVCIKATEATNYINPAMQAQYDRAKADGKEVWFYHYHQPAFGANDQADFFFAAIQGKQYAKTVIDFEEFTNDQNDANQIALYSFRFDVLYLSLSREYLNTSFDKKTRQWTAQYPYSDGRLNYESADAMNDKSEFAWQFSSNPYDQSVVYDTAVSTPQPAPQPSEPVVQNDGKFGFRVDEIAMVGGIFQVRCDFLCPTGFTWTDNGIPFTYITKKGGANGDNLQIGDHFTFDDNVVIKQSATQGTGGYLWTKIGIPNNDSLDTWISAQGDIRHIVYEGGS